MLCVCARQAGWVGVGLTTYQRVIRIADSEAIAHQILPAWRRNKSSLRRQPWRRSHCIVLPDRPHSVDPKAITLGDNHPSTVSGCLGHSHHDPNHNVAAHSGPTGGRQYWPARCPSRRRSTNRSSASRPGLHRNPHTSERGRAGARGKVRAGVALAQDALRCVSFRAGARSTRDVRRDRRTWSGSGLPAAGGAVAPPLSAATVGGRTRCLTGCPHSPGRGDCNCFLRPADERRCPRALTALIWWLDRPTSISSTNIWQVHLV